MHLKNRFAGCLLGGAVGDALGAPIEFMPLTTIHQNFGPEGIRDFIPAYGRAGAITDDTQMTLFTAEGLIRSVNRQQDRGLFSPVAVVGHAYHRWLITQGERSPVQEFVARWPGWLFKQDELHHRRAPGNTCLSALRGAPDAESLARNDSKGCGAVMRMAPVGLMGCRGGWSRDTTLALGSDLGHLTHGHPSGYLSAGAFAVIVQALAEGHPLINGIESALAGVTQYDHHDEVSAGLQQAVDLSLASLDRDSAIAHLGEGWVGEEALAIGVYCALVADTLEEGITLAANITGDSDSTASIAGNLLGTLHGAEAIPRRWLARLELRDVIEEIAGDLHDCIRWHDFPDDLEEVWQKYPPN